ncbi:type IV secretory system conjugative DNA transfer family protein [Mycoplasmopsis glycophila]|uniref:Type IV secretory pathway, VirD4 components n=2 Tax=Mycoplasmopsis glycophila TaxID=171285 RepID=A0A449AVR7_9BACT|nr:type IV secretory system conjugative DNA transfer family protein [Mycoplasmopsis glycophila]VEU70675.1 Type IV secretory pathway, VirD4 components [Mycoplasmopsis glycophila]
MLSKTLDKIFDFKNDFKKALIKTILIFFISLPVLYFMFFTLLNINKLIIQKEPFFTAFKTFLVSKWKLSLTFVALYLLGYSMLIFVANIGDFEKKYTKDKNENDVFLWNSRTGKGNWKRVQEKFIKPKPKANWVLGYYENKKKEKVWLVNNQDTHAKIIGGTGSGKSQFLVLPNITYNASLPFEEKPCMFITDPKKELYETMSNFFNDNGYEIKLIDLIDSTGETWNPLVYSFEILNSKTFESVLPSDYEKAISSINEIVEDLGWPDGKSDIWLRASKNILTAIYIYLLLKTQNNPLFKELGIQRLNVKDFHILKAADYLNPKTFKNGAWRTEIEKMSQNNIYWERLYNIFATLPDQAQNTLEGFLSNAQDVINGYSRNYKLAEIISSCSLSLQNLFDNISEKPFVIFICYPDEEESVNKFNSLFVKQLYNYATKEANKNPNKHLARKFQFYLEEFANLVRIDNFDKAISIARSRWIFFLIIIQSYAQLKKYDTGKGESTTIIDNTALTYFISSSSVETMESVIKSIGKKEIINRSYQEKDKNGGFSSSIQEKSILDINNLKEKPKEDVLIDIPNEKPFIWTMIPFYKGFTEIINDQRSFEYQVSESLKKIHKDKEKLIIQERKKTKKLVKNENYLTDIEEAIMSNEFSNSQEYKELFGIHNLNLFENANIYKNLSNEINLKIIEKTIKDFKRKRKSKNDAE